jgi:hypothetical protein
MSSEDLKNSPEIDDAEYVPHGDPCPACGTIVKSMRKIEAGMRLSLTKENVTDIPAECCDSCYRGFERLVSKGAKLRAEQMAMEQQRLVLWRSRMNLVRQGRELMERNLLSEAAIVYEKYLKVLQLVYQVDSKGLTPELFKGRPTEITVIASVYWDLLRIYDVSPRHLPRQKEAAQKLAEFGQFTPIYGTILRQAQTAYRHAKNPEVYREFLKASSKMAPRCFVATSAFEGGWHPEVQILCKFRDQVLQSFTWGRRFIAFYYMHGPHWAEHLDRVPVAKPPVRAALRLTARCVSRFFNLNP